MDVFAKRLAIGLAFVIVSRLGFFTPHPVQGSSMARRAAAAATRQVPAGNGEPGSEASSSSSSPRRRGRG